MSVLRKVFGSRVAIAALAVVMAVAQGALAQAPSSAPTLAGFWYGIGEPGDPEMFYVDAFHPDGRFNAMYGKCEKGQLVNRQTQTGTWKIEDGVLTINATEVNGEPRQFDHSYTIELLTATELHARLHDPDFLFVERRIPRFEFPPCYLGV